MQTVNTISELRACLSNWKQRGERLALVPTMGNLHAGHISLIEIARQHADRCVSSLFVNPTQFGPGEDFGSYPRTLSADAEKLHAAGTDLLFVPSTEELYPWRSAQNCAESPKSAPPQATRVSVPDLTSGLCGASRPDHFDGVTTVVTILFNLVNPDVAVFGKKDYQQLAVLKKMIRELHLPVEIIGGEIVRENDGLAMSSRNQYLTEAERAIAPGLQQTLAEMAKALEQGDRSETAIAAMMARATESLISAGFKPDYLELRRRDLTQPDNPDYGELVLLAAAWLGRARLLDNIEIPALAF